MITVTYQKKLIVDNTLPEKKDDWSEEQKAKEVAIRRTKEKA